MSGQRLINVWETSNKLKPSDSPKGSYVGTLERSPPHLMHPKFVACATTLNQDSSRPSCAFAQAGRESLEVSWIFTSRPSIQGPEVYPHPSCRWVCSSCDEHEKGPPAATAITRGRGWGIYLCTFLGLLLQPPFFDQACHFWGHSVPPVGIRAATPTLPIFPQLGPPAGQGHLRPSKHGSRGNG